MFEYSRFNFKFKEYQLVHLYAGIAYDE